MADIHDTVFVHPASVQIGRVTAGEHSSLWPGSVIRADFAPITVGRFTSIQDNCTLHSAPGAPLTIGDFVTVAHNTVLHGCTIGDGCLISMGSVVQDHAKIGKGSIVAAGAVVLEGAEFPDESLILGVPAKRRDGKPGQYRKGVNNALSYAALAHAYLSGRDTIQGEELIRLINEMKEKAGV